MHHFKTYKFITLILCLSIGQAAAEWTHPELKGVKLQTGDLIMQRSLMPEMAALQEVFEGPSCPHAGLFYEHNGEGYVFHQMTTGIKRERFIDRLKESNEFYVFRLNPKIQANLLLKETYKLEKGLKGYDAKFDRDGPDGFYYCLEIISLAYTRSGHPDPFPRSLSLNNPLIKAMSMKFKIGPLIFGGEVFANENYTMILHHEETRPYQESGESEIYAHFGRVMRKQMEQGQDFKLNQMEDLRRLGSQYVTEYKHYITVEVVNLERKPGGKRALRDPVVKQQIKDKVFAKMDQKYFNITPPQNLSLL
ncbi:MAG: hypothetical protein SGI71_12590 [Verrucomicrobiota bacterium]|nr:hypothetical protein [Verrucomicrobiota bacterium]